MNDNDADAEDLDDSRDFNLKDERKGQFKLQFDAIEEEADED